MTKKKLKYYSKIEDSWICLLDEACYRVARGARLLDFPVAVTKMQWKNDVAPMLEELMKHHGVVIRREPYDGRGKVELQVARYQWVFGLLDMISVNSWLMGHAIRGVLLGYDASQINEFLIKMKEISNGNNL